MSKEILIMMVKAPITGQVKTRLGAHLGHEIAAALQSAFIQDMNLNLESLSAERVLACYPTTQHPLFTQLETDGWRLWPQVGSDLGERLEMILSRAFEEDAQRVVIIGSDSPTLPLAHIQDAFHILRSNQVTIGPASDGGYCLIGASERGLPLFDQVTWSSPHVFEETCSNLNTGGFSYRTLPEWYDVDKIEDLHRLDNEIRVSKNPGSYTHTSRVLVTINLSSHEQKST
jgi:hypothetical protein